MITQTGTTAQSYANLGLGIPQAGFYTLGVEFDATDAFTLAIKRPAGVGTDLVIALTSTVPKGEKALTSVYLEPGDDYEFKVVGTATASWTARFWLYEGTDLA